MMASMVVMIYGNLNRPLSAIPCSAQGNFGLPPYRAEWTGFPTLSEAQLIIELACLSMLLAFFLDGISTVERSTGVILPAASRRHRPAAVGIFVGLVVETAQITPQVVYVNLFVLQDMTRRECMRIECQAARRRADAARGSAVLPVPAACHLAAAKTRG